MRAGAWVLSLLATPGVVAILRALEAGPLTPAELGRAVGSLPQTTMRARLRELAGLGVLERDDNAAAGSADCLLCEPGRDLLAIATVLEHWLAAAQRPPGPLGEAAAKRTVKALVDGWDGGVIGILAATPLPLTELGRRVPDLSYPSLERRITAMRAAGLLASGESDGRGTPCLPTAWLRRAAGPIAAAARFERRRFAAGRAARVDVQALLLLAMPIAPPLHDSSGTATLVTREPGDARGAKGPVTGITVELRDGLLRKCAAGVAEGTPTWALGVPDGWLETAVSGTLDRLRFGGAEPRLATVLARSFHEALRMGGPDREEEA